MSGKIRRFSIFSPCAGGLGAGCPSQNNLTDTPDEWSEMFQGVAG